MIRQYLWNNCREKIDIEKYMRFQVTFLFIDEFLSMLLFEKYKKGRYIGLLMLLVSRYVTHFPFRIK